MIAATNGNSMGTRLALLEPPYQQLTAITMGWKPASLPPQGLALVWWLTDGVEQAREMDWLNCRVPGLPVIVVLPSAREIGRAAPLLGRLPDLHPRAVLPEGPLATPAHLCQLLRFPPQQIPEGVTGYLMRRGLIQSQALRNAVRRIFQLAPETRSIAKLARRLYTSRRTLGRCFSSAGLPVPSHWLQFGRLLQVAMNLQNDQANIFRIASSVGYPDGFTASNQMMRLLGVRPSHVRRCLGWEWIVEAWLQREVHTGGIDVQRYSHAVRDYVPG